MGREMNPQVKVLWLDALRHGDYVQGVGALRNPDNSFCCLGVLCDVAVSEGVDVTVSANEGQVYKYDDRIGGLPRSVQQWAGMYDSMGGRSQDDPNGNYKPCLADLNDDGKTFAEIADIIEKEF